MRIGLVGAGRWGKRYIETLKHVPGVQLAHLASGNPESIKLVPKGCRVTPNWREVAANRVLDGVILATPPATHAEMALAVIGAGVPVLIEKPMALSLQDAHAIVDAAENRGVLAMIGHTHLYSNAFRALKQKGNSLGSLRHTRSAGGSWGPFRPDAPMLWDWGPHDIAMCLDLFGSHPRRVHATLTGIATAPQRNGEAIAITLDFERGARSEIHVSNIERQKRRVFEATYASGKLIYDDLAENKLVYYANSASAEPIAIDKSLPLGNLVAAFCRAIEKGEGSNPSLLLGLKVIEILAACELALNRAEHGDSEVLGR